MNHIWFNSGWSDSLLRANAPRFDKQADAGGKKSKQAALQPLPVRNSVAFYQDLLQVESCRCRSVWRGLLPRFPADPLSGCSGVCPLRFSNYVAAAGATRRRSFRSWRLHDSFPQFACAVAVGAACQHTPSCSLAASIYSNWKSTGTHHFISMWSYNSPFPSICFFFFKLYFVFDLYCWAKFVIVYYD